MHQALSQTNMLPRPLRCGCTRHGTFFLSELTLFDPVVTPLNLGIFLIMHGSAMAHGGLTNSVMTLWAEFPEIELQRIITRQYNEPLPIC